MVFLFDFLRALDHSSNAFALTQVLFCHPQIIVRVTPDDHQFRKEESEMVGRLVKRMLSNSTQMSVFGSH